MELDVGVHQIDMVTYQSDPCPEPSLSRGIIQRLIYECPAKVWHCHPRLNPNYVEEPSSAPMDMGAVLHSLFLEGVDIAVPIDPTDYPAKNGNIPEGWTNNAIREARDKVKGSGKIPLLLADYNRAKKIVDAAHEQLADSELGILALKAEGHSELTYIWQEDNVWCRIRPDWVSSDSRIIIDYKSTKMSASPNEFTRNIIATGIDVQAAFYRMGIQTIDHADPLFILFVQEITEPFLCAPIALTPQFIALGESKVREGLAKWKECVASGKWPGYPSRVSYVEPPPWALASWEERKFSGQLAEQEGKDDPF